MMDMKVQPSRSINWLKEWHRQLYILLKKLKVKAIEWFFENISKLMFSTNELKRHNLVF